MVPPPAWRARPSEPALRGSLSRSTRTVITLIRSSRPGRASGPLRSTSLRGQLPGYLCWPMRPGRYHGRSNRLRNAVIPRHSRRGGPGEPALRRSPGTFRPPARFLPRAPSTAPCPPASAPSRPSRAPAACPCRTAPPWCPAPADCATRPPHDFPGWRSLGRDSRASHQAVSRRANIPRTADGCGFLALPTIWEADRAEGWSRS